MNTAKVNYELDVQDGCKKVDYCVIKFTGGNAEIYRNYWNKLRHEKYYVNREKVRKYRAVQESINTELLKMKSELVGAVRERKTELLVMIERGMQLVSILDERAEECKAEFFYTPQELYSKAKEFLAENKFRFENTIIDDMNIDVWSKQE